MLKLDLKYSTLNSAMTETNPFNIKNKNKYEEPEAKGFKIP